MKLVTWNVNGIRSREAELLRLLDEEKPDVAMLQETKATAEQLPASLYGLLGLPAYHSIWHGSAGYSGVSVHLRKDVFERPRDAHPPFDFETRVAEAHAVTKTGERFVLVSMYLPNGGKDYQAKLAFMRALANYPSTLASDNVIVAGDLNVARSDMDVHESERKPRAIGQRPEERKLFEQFLGAGLVDVCRELAPDDRELFTWWPYWNEQRARNVGWRIDYVLATRSLASRAKEFRVRRDFGTSDHAPVVVTFGPSQLQPNA
ncbi:MAG TPA: exodeoxyribonuclease III [Polyangiaceae bacterium]